MDKAAAYMQRFGWEQGKGLGRKEDGMVEHIKSYKKQDSAGVGFSTEFKHFGWWAHVYNTATIKTQDDETKKPTEAASTPAPPPSFMAMYGGSFVRGKTLLDSKTEVSDSESSEDDPVTPANVAHVDTEKLFEACGGRTLRRHQPTGKLERLAEQERQLAEQLKSANGVANGNSARVETTAAAPVITPVSARKRKESDKAEKKEDSSDEKSDSDSESESESEEKSHKKKAKRAKVEPKELSKKDKKKKSKKSAKSKEDEKKKDKKKKKKKAKGKKERKEKAKGSDDDSKKKDKKKKDKKRKSQRPRRNDESS